MNNKEYLYVDQDGQLWIRPVKAATVRLKLDDGSVRFAELIDEWEVANKATEYMLKLRDRRKETETNSYYILPPGYDLRNYRPGDIAVGPFTDDSYEVYVVGALLVTMAGALAFLAYNLIT